MFKVKGATGLVIFALFSMFAVSCHRGESSKEESANIIVAVIDGKEIHGDVFLKEYRRFKKRIKLSDVNDEELEKQMRDGIMDNLIRYEIIAGEAGKSGIKVTKEMETVAIQSMLKGFSQERLQVIMEKQGQTYEEWKDSVRQNLLMEKLIASKITPMVEVPEALLKKYYDDHPDDYKKPAQARTYHILCSTFADAEKARGELVTGTDFSDAARKYSKSPEASHGGDLGMVSQGQMPKELDDAIFKLKEKEVSRVVESPYGFHLLKVTEFAKPRQMSFAESKEQIYNHVFQEQLEKKFEEWIQETKKNAKIEVFTDRLYRL